MIYGKSFGSIDFPFLISHFSLVSGQEGAACAR
jgi:hypothetical protein